MNLNPQDIVDRMSRDLAEVSSNSWERWTVARIEYEEDAANLAVSIKVWINHPRLSPNAYIEWQVERPLDASDGQFGVMFIEQLLDSENDPMRDAIRRGDSMVIISTPG